MSLEVSVTKDLRVIDLRACNDDGKRILKEMKRWENKHLQDVIRTIIKQSQEDKYLTNDKQVMLTAVTKDKSLEPELEKAMQELKKEYEIKHVTVEYQNSTMQMRENAKKAGIGTGVYIKQENEKKNRLFLLYRRLIRRNTMGRYKRNQSHLLMHHRICLL